mmetsp:Transcript_41546/g.39955  ORF Transcript_41546/g.39955 Transcript_41546/m.39955 type:complete len:96 (+) Transcript_41546:1416-1703(+)
MSKIMLSKYQRQLLPHFKSYLLDDNPLNLQDPPEQKETLQLYLMQAIVQSENSKVDKKILKNITRERKKEEDKGQRMGKNVLGHQILESAFAMNN